MNDGPQAVPHAVNRDDIANLTAHVVRLRVTEVVLALEERRNALPLADLLRIKTTGVHVNEFSSFIERETGRVDLDSVNPSWLIFSDGFSSGRRLSAAGKRLFDIIVSGVHPARLRAADPPDRAGGEAGEPRARPSSASAGSASTARASSW